MTDDEALDLFREYRRNGDVETRNRLVANYYGTAEIIARKFARGSGYRAGYYDDLLQVAYEALIISVERFDPDMGTRFTTYATPTITGYIKNYIRDQTHSIRTPRDVYSTHMRIKAFENEYFHEHAEPPTTQQVADALGISVESVLEASEYYDAVSLDSAVDGENGETKLYEVISESDDSFESVEDRESIISEIDRLDPGEQKLIRLRYMDGKSQAETGKILGVSQMFVSRAERRIVEKIRNGMEDTGS